MATMKTSILLDKETGYPRPTYKYTSGARAPLGMGKDGQPIHLAFAGSSGPSGTPAWVAVAVIC